MIPWHFDMQEDQQEQPKPVTTSPSPPQPQQTPRLAPKVPTLNPKDTSFFGFLS